MYRTNIWIKKYKMWNKENMSSDVIDEKILGKKQSWSVKYNNINIEVSDTYIYFLLPLYSGCEVWESIWNQTHFSGIEFLSREITPRYHISQ